MRDKQIEEMAKVLDIASIRGCIHLSCSDCRLYHIENDYCRKKVIAEHLYNAGYRKASDVAREIIRILRAAGIDKYRYPVIAEIEKKYESEGEG